MTQESHNKEDNSRAKRPTRIVVAESDEAMRTFLINSLRRLGYEVKEIGNAVDMDAYLKQLSDHDSVSFLPDVIISSLCMPGLTDLDILMKFKEVVHDIPVILITTLEDDQTQELAVNLGAAAVFDKPFNMERLKDFLLGKAPPLTPVRCSKRETNGDKGRRANSLPVPPDMA